MKWRRDLTAPVGIAACDDGGDQRRRGLAEDVSLRRCYRDHGAMIAHHDKDSLVEEAGRTERRVELPYRLVHVAKNRFLGTFTGIRMAIRMMGGDGFYGHHERPRAVSKFRDELETSLVKRSVADRIEMMSPVDILVGWMIVAFNVRETQRIDPGFFSRELKIARRQKGGEIARPVA